MSDGFGAVVGAALLAFLYGIAVFNDGGPAGHSPSSWPWLRRSICLVCSTSYEIDATAGVELVPVREELHHAPIVSHGERHDVEPHRWFTES